MFYQTQVCFCRYCHWHCWYIKVWSRCVNYRLRIDQKFLGLNPDYSFSRCSNHSNKCRHVCNCVHSESRETSVSSISNGSGGSNVSSASSVSHCGYHRYFVTKVWAASADAPAMCGREHWPRLISNLHVRIPVWYSSNWYGLECSLGVVALLHVHQTQHHRHHCCNRH